MGVQITIVTLDAEQNFELQGKYSKHDLKIKFLKSYRNIPSCKNLKLISTIIYVFTEILRLDAHFEMGLQWTISALRIRESETQMRSHCMRHTVGKRTVSALS